MFYLKYLCFIFFVHENISFKTTDKGKFLNKRQIEFANTLKDYELSVPARVTRSGNYLTNNISHSVNHEQLKLFNKNNYRRKRSTSYYAHLSSFNDSEENPFSNDYSDDNPTLVHYHVTIDHKTYMLDLLINSELVSPTLLIENDAEGWNLGGNLEKNDYLSSNAHYYNAYACHFIGRIRGYMNSKVAVATCNGLHGFIDFGIGDHYYFIEPMEKNSYKETSGNNTEEQYDLIEDMKHVSNVSNVANDNEKENFHLIYKNTDIPIGGKIMMKRNAVNNKKNVIEKNVMFTNENNSREFYRKKRSTSVLNKVECLVVVDKIFQEYHSGQDMKRYILTLMNMVAAMYHDASLGNSVDITIVRIKFLKSSKLDEISDSNTVLTKFCEWSRALNPTSDNNAFHHDNAILITRGDLCVNGRCSTIGLGHLGGMCSPSHSCNVNEDSGLMLAHTIAHEIGHNFGMTHDSNENRCYPSHDDDSFIMPPVAIIIGGPLVWSPCSREAITTFFDKGYGKCLEDEPITTPLPYLDNLPGVLYDKDQQCVFGFGNDYQWDNSSVKVCSRLYCRNRLTGYVVTRNSPAVEGTECFINKWCYHGECIVKGQRPHAIDGSWGSWSSYSECSRTCGGGVSSSKRLCDNPPPEHGGSYCLGVRTSYQTCKIEQCDQNKPTFRQVQCSKFDFQNGSYDTWKPPESSTSSCNLVCVSLIDNHPFGKILVVEDGTPCEENSQSNNMCIAGKCVEIGCDWKINSTSTSDYCGVCNGDGSTCQNITITYLVKITPVDYSVIALLPKGARHVIVKHRANNENYFAVRSSTKKDEYYLNGNSIITFPGIYKAGGTTIVYSRDSNFIDMLTIEGPIIDPLFIELVKKDQNSGIDINYVISNSSNVKEYIWTYDSQTECDSICGGGSYRIIYKCMNKISKQFVPDNLCEDEHRKESVYSCNKKPCITSWKKGRWENCTATCHNAGTESRSIKCKEQIPTGTIQTVSGAKCNHLKVPKLTKLCYKVCDYKPALGEWITGPWSECNEECGHGYNTRNVDCSTRKHDDCLLEEKPIYYKRCINKNCPEDYRQKGNEILLKMRAKRKMSQSHLQDLNLSPTGEISNNNRDSVMLKQGPETINILSNEIPTNQDPNKKENKQSGNYNWLKLGRKNV